MMDCGLLAGALLRHATGETAASDAPSALPPQRCDQFRAAVLGAFRRPPLAIDRISSTITRCTYSAGHESRNRLYGTVVVDIESRRQRARRLTAHTMTQDSR